MFYFRDYPRVDVNLGGFRTFFKVTPPYAGKMYKNPVHRVVLESSRINGSTSGMCDDDSSIHGGGPERAIWGE